jgi:hypothetical protein
MCHIWRVSVPVCCVRISAACVPARDTPMPWRFPIPNRVCGRPTPWQEADEDGAPRATASPRPCACLATTTSGTSSWRWMPDYRWAITSPGNWRARMTFQSPSTSKGLVNRRISRCFRSGRRCTRRRNDEAPRELGGNGGPRPEVKRAVLMAFAADCSITAPRRFGGGLAVARVRAADEACPDGALRAAASDVEAVRPR